MEILDLFKHNRPVKCGTAKLVPMPVANDMFVLFMVRTLIGANESPPGANVDAFLLLYVAIVPFLVLEPTDST